MGDERCFHRRSDENIRGTQRSAAQITKSRFLIVLFLCYNFQKSVARMRHYVNRFRYEFSLYLTDIANLKPY